jgi:hypothetical protein
MLESLVIWDDENDGDSRAVITDNLLHRLTLSAGDTSLVPHLSWVRFNSLIRFSDDSLSDFIRSRIDNGIWFETEIRWFTGCDRHLSGEFVAQLSALDRFSFTFSPHNYN